MAEHRRIHNAEALSASEPEEVCIAPPGNLCTNPGCWDADRCIVDADWLKPHVTQALNGTLACSACGTQLAVMLTAYGARAHCGCPDIRWTAIREREPIASEWVAEKR